MPPTDPPFQSLAYDGERFVRHSLPVDVLPDLLAYRDLLVEVAKELFRTEHQRKRVPKGFDEHLRLDLVDIGQGSAIAQLDNLAETSVEGDATGFGAYYDRARDVISECIAAAAGNRPLPAQFPERLLSYFNAFGRTLQPDEVIRMGGGEGRASVTYSGAVRTQLVLRSTQRVERPVDLVGLVTDLFGNEYLFTLTVPGMTPVRAPFHEAMQSVLLEAFDHRTQQWQVRVTGVGIYDRNDQLLKIASTTHVELAEAPEVLSLRSRLSAMIELEPGWFEPGSLVPKVDLITQATAILVALFDGHNVPVPHVYPRPDGGIQAEWDGETFTVEARFTADGRTVRLSADPKGDGDSADEELPLSATESTAKAAEWLLRHLGRNG